MAVLNAAQLAELRRKLALVSGAVNYTKPQANAAAQAVEDWLEGNRSTLSAAINTATSPLVLTAGQKQALFAQYVLQKSGREGAI